MNYVRLPHLYFLSFLSAGFVLIIIHLYILSHIQFTPWPEMILYPWMVSKGLSLYKDIINPYWPGLSWGLHWWFQATGYTLESLQRLSWGIVVVNDLLILGFGYFLTRSKVLSLVGLVWYVAWQPFLGGNGLWHDLAVTPLLTAAGVWLIRFSLSSRWLAVVGVCLGIALVIKQTVVWCLIAAAVIIWLRSKEGVLQTVKKIFLMGAPSVVLVLMLWLYFGLKGSFADFWLWTIHIPQDLIEGFPEHRQLPTFRQLLITLAVLLPMVGLIKLGLKKVLASSLWLGALLAFTYPRFEYLHLQPILPAIVLIGMTVFIAYSPQEKLWTRLMVGLFFISLAAGILISTRQYSRVWNQPPRFLTAEVTSLVGYVGQQFPDYSFEVINGPHLLYWLLDQPPRSPWSDTFPWYLEVGNVQEQIVNQWQENSPDLIVGNLTAGDSQAIGEYTPELLGDFVREEYNKLEVVNGYQIWMRNIR